MATGWLVGASLLNPLRQEAPPEVVGPPALSATVAAVVGESTRGLHASDPDEASLVGPVGLAVGPAPEGADGPALYVADNGAGVVRMVVDDTVTTIAGVPDGDFLPETATAGQTVDPMRYRLGVRAVAVDHSGALVAATDRHVVRLAEERLEVLASGFEAVDVAVLPDGEVIVAVPTEHRISTLAGRELLPASAALDGGRSFAPWGIDVAADGTVVFSDDTTDSLWSVDPAGVLTQLAPARHSSSELRELDIAPDGSIFVADPGAEDVARLDGSVLVAHAGDGRDGPSVDGLPPLESSFRNPQDVAALADGSLYVAERDTGLVRVVTATEVRTAVGPAIRLDRPLGLWVGDGDRLLVDERGRDVRAVTDTNRLRPGSLVRDDGVVAPLDVVGRGDGELWVTDGGIPDRNDPDSNGVVWRVDAKGRAVAIVGGGKKNLTAGDPPADGREVALDRPLFIAEAPGGAGVVYFSDSVGNRIYEAMEDDGNVTVRVVVGDGTAGFSVDGTPAREARIATPTGIAFTEEGDLVFAESGNGRIRTISSDGRIRTLVGNGTRSATVPGLGPRETGTANVYGVAVDAAGTMYYAEITGQVFALRNGVVTSLVGSELTEQLDGVATAADHTAGGGGAGNPGLGPPAPVRRRPRARRFDPLRLRSGGRAGLHPRSAFRSRALAVSGRARPASPRKPRKGCAMTAELPSGRRLWPLTLVLALLCSLGAAQASSAEPRPTETYEYVVERGDTLTTIAAGTGTTVEILRDLNGLADVDDLPAGTVLLVPVPQAERDPQPTLPPSTSSTTVEAKAAEPEASEPQSTDGGALTPLETLVLCLIVGGTSGVAAALLLPRNRRPAGLARDRRFRLRRARRRPAPPIDAVMPPAPRPAPVSVLPPVRPVLVDALVAPGAPAPVPAAVLPVVDVSPPPGPATGRQRPSFRVEPIRPPEPAVKAQPVSEWAGEIVGREPIVGATTAKPLTGTGWPPAVIAEFGEHGPFVFRGASIRGDYARAAGTPRQDSFCVGVGPAGELVIAVADGVAAARHSEYGAYNAALTAMGVLVREGGLRPADRLGQAVAESSVALRALAEREGFGEGADVATTLVLAVVEDRDVKVARVGDSSVWILSDGTWTDLFSVGEKAVHESKVRALPIHEECELRRVALRDGDVLVLGTDGLGDPFGEGTTPVAAYLARAWAAVPEPLRFVQTLSFRARSFDDDRTAVALWRRTP